MPSEPQAEVDAARVALTRIGWRSGLEPALSKALAEATGEGLRLVRIIAQHRTAYDVHNGIAQGTAQAPPEMTRRGGDPMRRAAVGDWVLIDAGNPAVIRHVLPRHSMLVRAAAGERYSAQPIAANVDTAFVVCGLDGDYNTRRIERYLALIEGSGVAALVVLTKRDLNPEADSVQAELARIVGAAVPVLAVNAKDLVSAEQLAPWCRPGDTLVLLGSSGAGKSTLTNALLGQVRQKTADVRAHDSRGRHTTTYRSLVALPSGACIIDTPGMRELKLTGDESLQAGHFSDIEQIAADCRFRDCGHESEPGCAVQAAVTAGTLDAARFEHFRKLQAEQAATLAHRAVGERKRQSRVMTKALHARLDDKYGSH